MADSIETTIPGTVASASIASSAGDGPSAVEVEVLELFDRLRERLLGYLLRFNALSTADAEDVVQEAFLALYQHLQRGRSRENLPGWLFRVVHNLGLKRAQGSRRDTQRTVLLAEASEDVVVDHAPNPEAASAEGQMQRRTAAVIHALPEQDQRCLMLRAEGLRYREIAETLEMSLGAVAKSLERSLQRIARATEQ